jgi:hypothetical protein
VIASALQGCPYNFSVYVLDPLESLFDSHARGVAVGLGLMSWALSADDGKQVTGTLITTAHSEDVLEVILALREVSCLLLLVHILNN